MDAEHHGVDLREALLLMEFDNMDAGKTFYESDEYTAAGAIRFVTGFSFRSNTKTIS